jgi:hypothetical protein
MRSLIKGSIQLAGGLIGSGRGERGGRVHCNRAGEWAPAYGLFVRLLVRYRRRLGAPRPQSSRVLDLQVASTYL